LITAEQFLKPCVFVKMGHHQKTLVFQIIPI
jgi:hypothetical protein